MAEATHSTTVDLDASGDDTYEPNANEQSSTEGWIDVQEHPKQGKRIAEKDHKL